MFVCEIILHVYAFVCVWFPNIGESFMGLLRAPSAMQLNALTAISFALSAHSNALCCACENKSCDTDSSIGIVALIYPATWAADIT